MDNGTTPDRDAMRVNAAASKRTAAILRRIESAPPLTRAQVETLHAALDRVTLLDSAAVVRGVS